MSRLVGDLLVMRLEQPRFTWGRTNLVDAGATRHAYAALRQSADRGDIGIREVVGLALEGLVDRQLDRLQTFSIWARY